MNDVRNAAPSLVLRNLPVSISRAGNVGIHGRPAIGWIRRIRDNCSYQSPAGPARHAGLSDRSGQP